MYKSARDVHLISQGFFQNFQDYACGRRCMCDVGCQNCSKMTFEYSLQKKPIGLNHSNIYICTWCQEDKLIQRDTTTCVGIFGIPYLGSNSWQNSLKPVPSTILIGFMSSHMNEASIFVHTCCRAADKELVAGGEKYELRCGCFSWSSRPVQFMARSFGCTFSRCALMLLVVEWLTQLAYNFISRLRIFAVYLSKYFQTGLFRLLGVQTTLSAAELGSEFSAILFFLSAICICHSVCCVSLSAVSDACKRDSCDLSLTRHTVKY